jgi:hypothetical protein
MATGLKLQRDRMWRDRKATHLGNTFMILRAELVHALIGSPDDQGLAPDWLT